MSLKIEDRVHNARYRRQGVGWRRNTCMFRQGQGLDNLRRNLKCRGNVVVVQLPLTCC
jgi:hypothetical protein